MLLSRIVSILLISTKKYNIQLQLFNQNVYEEYKQYIKQYKRDNFN